MNKPIEVKRKPIKCPICGFKPVGTILSGLPAFDEKMEKDIECGKIIIGGCLVTDNQPQWACKACGTEFIREVDYRFIEIFLQTS